MNTVLGEKEVQSFTQKNIDNNELLYAQLNMYAFEVSSLSCYIKHIKTRT
jgi:hypothetical protein